MSKTPVIDLFAGPGGLGEGFEQAGFQIKLSIEKDAIAWQTLRLRALCRMIPSRHRGEITAEAFAQPDPNAWILKLFPELTEAANQLAWCATLGENAHSEVSERIEEALAGSDDWILLGGPPCQAYSVVGRSRMQNKVAGFANDHRHYLYREYLQIVADHAPPVFLMENVKGLLSAKNKGQQMITRILTDLRSPRANIVSNPVRHGRLGLEYDIVPVVRTSTLLPEGPFLPGEFVVRSEEHGIPQARHRLFLLGLRRDLNLLGLWRGILPGDPATVRGAIADLPRIGSQISRAPDEFSVETLQLVLGMAWLKNLKNSKSDVAQAIIQAVLSMGRTSGTGSAILSRDKRRKPGILGDWYRYDRLPVILNHEARAHMPSDLHRYLFAAAFAQVRGKSPHLADFPRELLPNHKNVVQDGREQAFDDRFRVQCWDSPSSTVMSHISKDGHYYIHPDPSQCRSLTVREAARLQTFPDDYFFCGPRTHQFKQVGNAVPPYLAHKIAKAIKASFFP